MNKNPINKKTQIMFLYIQLFFIMISIQIIISCGNKTWKIEYQDDVKIIKNNFNRNRINATKETLKITELFSVKNHFNLTKNYIFGKIIWIDFDLRGNIYLLDAIDQNIVKISPQLNIEKFIGKKGKGPGELLGCSRFIWHKENIYCANSKNARIEIFSDDGIYLKSVKLIDCPKPSGIHFINGKFYIGQRKVSNNSYRLVEYNENLNFLSCFYNDDIIKDPMDVLRQWSTTRVCSNGFWMIYYQMNLIKFIALSGKTVFKSIPEIDWLIQNDNGNIIPEYPVHGPSDVDPNGYLYVIYNTPKDWRKRNDVYKYSPDGILLGKVFTLPIEEITMIRFDRKGDLYFSNGTNLYKAKIVN